MGNGQLPGIDLDGRTTIDDGTAIRGDSPPPGAIGLDAKNGSTKGTTATIGERVVSFASRHRGERVGNGECFTLADRALRSAAAKSAADFGAITPTTDYVWGTSVSLSDLQPGDIIQFRGYRYDREIVTETSREITTTEDSQERPHHTAIVQSVDGGAVTVLEQNAPDGSPVTRTQLFFTAGTTTSGNRTTTIRVQGTFWFYRPEAR